MKNKNDVNEKNLNKRYVDFFKDNNRYQEILKLSNNEKEFKDNYKAKLENDSELNNNLGKFQNLYDQLLAEKLKIFKIDLKSKNEQKVSQKGIIESKFNDFFNSNYDDVLKLSKNEIEFESEFEKKRKLNTEIEHYYNEYINYYNKLLNDKKKTFKIDLNNMKKKETTEIENEFLKFFNNNYERICNSSSSEEEFKRIFKNESKSNVKLKEYFQNDNSSYFDSLIPTYVEKFNNFLKNKTENEESRMKGKYLEFLNEKYIEVADASLNEEEFESKFKKKLNEKGELKNNFGKYKEYYEQIFATQINKFKTDLKKRIETSYLRNYDAAIKSSKDEVNFKTNLFKLLKNDSKIGNLIEKKEYKDYFDSLHNTSKIQIDLSAKEKSEKQSIILDTNTFFETKYEPIKNKVKDSNEFQKEIKKIASGEIKKSENFNSQLINYTKKFEEEKEKEREKKNKEEKMKKYKELETKLINDFMTRINTKEFEDTGSIEYFKKYDKSKFDKILQILFEIENYDDKIDNKIDSYINELLNDKNKKVNHLNVLLCGNSGAGKSTLINGFLELEGKDKVKTAIGEAVTMETKYITSPKFPIFRLADSRGIEISRNDSNGYGISEVVKSMNKFIQYQLETKNPDNYVHCIWYCVSPSDGRFNNVIVECLNELKDNYKIKGLPIIIVGTKANSPQFNKDLEDYLKKQNIKFPFHPVLALKLDDNEAFGLEELRLLSLEKAIDGIESSCYQGIIKNIIETSNLKVEEQKHIIDEKIKQKREEVFKNIENNPNFNNLKRYMNDTFIIILNQYSSINLSNINNKIQEIKLGEKSKKEIDKFINDYYNYCKDYYEQNYEKIINDRTTELMDKIKQEKTDFIESNLVLIETKSKKELKEEIEKEIKDKLKQKSNIYYFKNLYNELIDLLIKTFQDYFLGYFNFSIKKKENQEQTKDLIISKISNQFKELKLKIEEYNQKIINKKKKNEEENGSSQARDFFAKREQNKKK